MNRTQRRYKYRRPKSCEGKKKNVLEEVLAPRCRRQMLSRCCYITPDQRSFAQLTNVESPCQYQVQVTNDPYRPTAPDLKTIAEPNKLELITIAAPKRPTLPDMSTVAKQKQYLRKQPNVNKKTFPHRSPQSEVDTTTDPEDFITTANQTISYQRIQHGINRAYDRLGQPKNEAVNLYDTSTIDKYTTSYQQAKPDANKKAQPYRSDQLEVNTAIGSHDKSGIVKQTRSYQRTMPDANKKAQPNRENNEPEANTTTDLHDRSITTRPKRLYQRPIPDVNNKAQPYRPNQSEVGTVSASLDKSVAKPKRSLKVPPDVLATAKACKSAQLEDNSAIDPYIPPPAENTIGEQYRPALPDLTIAQLRELQKVFFPPSNNTEKTSQYVNPLEHSSSDEEMMQWQDVENVDEIQKMMTGRDEGTLTKYHNLSKNLYISEVPRVKLIAVKFTKYKTDNVEVRRLEEKVVCVEYDVFDKDVDATTPVQQMRAFFSIKPDASEKANVLTELPPTVKSKFNISTSDLQKLNQKEIEIIDGMVLENQPYLHDLKKLLRRKENALKNKNNLNLQALYDMGKRDLLDFDTNFDRNTMPKEELIEMQKLILKNCNSSVHGIRRRTVKKNSQVLEELAHSTMSRSLMEELLNESNKNTADF